MISGAPEERMAAQVANIVTHISGISGNVPRMRAFRSTAPALPLGLFLGLAPPVLRSRRKPCSDQAARNEPTPQLGQNGNMHVCQPAYTPEFAGRDTDGTNGRPNSKTDPLTA